MKNIFLNNSSQDIHNLEDMENCTTNIISLSKKIKDFKTKVNDRIYLGSFLLPTTIFMSLFTLSDTLSIAHLILNLLLSCAFSLPCMLLLLLVDLGSAGYSWRDKLNHKFFSLFKSFNHNQKLTSDYNEQLNQSLLDPNIERKLVLMLNDTLELCKKADNEYSIENINNFRSQLIQYFATKSYKELNVFITENLGHWKHTQESMVYDIESNNVYYNYMDKVNKFTQTNKVTYLEEEKEVYVETLNKKPQISF